MKDDHPAAAMSFQVIRLLTDLLEQCDAVERLVMRGKIAYDDDEMLRFAGEDLLIRAGETVARLDKVEPGFVGNHEYLELRRLKDARNLVAHGYDIVDSDIVWTILEAHIPRVAASVRKWLGQGSK